MNKNMMKWLICILIAIAAAFGGYMAGKNSAETALKAEQERHVQIMRSDLEGLGEIEGTIYVTGHKSPDSDTVGSAVAYAALLQKLGYDAVAVVLGPINNETKYVFESGGLEVPELLVDASGLNMVLVDHSEYAQSADGLEDANIISIIDHHSDGSVTTGNQLIYDARPLGSTATIIWTRYYNYGVEIDTKTAYAMVGSILSDTKNLQSANTTYADREALKELSALAGITDIDSFYQDMYQASISYDGMSDEEIFFSDYKEYETGSTHYAIGCVNAYDDASALEMAERMRAILPAMAAKKGMDMSFAQINIFHDDLSVTYMVGSDEAAEEVLNTAFADTAVHEGITWRIEPYASRKGVIVPAITDVLESYPGE